MQTKNAPLLKSRPVASGGARVRAHRTLCSWIEDGVLRQGQPLPSERELTQSLNVSRGTLRSVLEMLSEEGLIRSNGGRARTVSTPNKSPRWIGDAVGVLSFGTDGLPHQADWSDNLTQGVMEELRAAGRHTLSLNPESLDESEIAHLATQGPSGFIVTEIATDLSGVAKLAQSLSRGGASVAVYGGAPEVAAFDRVSSDHRLGAYSLTTLLQRSGHARVAMLWGEDDDYWFAARRAGYERARNEASLAILPTIVVPALTHENTTKALFERSVRHYVGYLFEYWKELDALLLPTDALVPIVAASGQLLGRQLPLAGYDDYWSECADRQFYDAAPFATINKRNRDMGRELVRLLSERERGLLPDAPQERVLEPLLVRPTT